MIPETPALGIAPSAAGDRLPAPAWAYMLRCADGSLYSGWTNDLARRLKAHNGGAHGARYTRAHGGGTLAYAQRFDTKGEAMRREAGLKRLPKADKEALAARWLADNTATLRAAGPEDAAAVNELYCWYVRHSTATFQYGCPTVAETRAEIETVWQRAPFLAAVGGDGHLMGYACAHPWHTREAYAWDVELTVYCAPDAVGRGVGRRLYTALLDILKAQGYCNALALVARPNPASAAFHKAMGFARIGREPRTGYKFGRWLDLDTWLLPLRPGDAPPAPVTLTPPAEAVARALAAANRPKE